MGDEPFAEVSESVAEGAIVGSDCDMVAGSDADTVVEGSADCDGCVVVLVPDVAVVGVVLTVTTVPFTVVFAPPEACTVPDCGTVDGPS